MTGPCSDASQAPECPFTWGSAGTDKYWGASPTFYGFNQKIVKSFSKLRQIKAQITLRLLTGNMNGAGANGFAACNLVLGFGESDQDNPDNPNLPLDLNIGNRNSFKDLIHFSYQIFQDGADRLNIENRINVGVDPSFPANAIYEGDFNLTGNDPLVANNDFITYQIQINFVHESEQALVTLTPLDSNKNVESMEKQEIIWDYFSDINRVDNSEPRAGVAVDLDGAEPLSRDEFLNSDVVVGFGSNGVVKECSVEGLSVEWDLK